MKAGLVVVGTALVASTCAYMCDPNNGHRRRMIAKDKTLHFSKGAWHFLDVARRDIRNRLVGVFGDLRYRLRGRDVADERLVHRVAAKLGRYVSHPKTITISSSNGCITLEGLILERELRPVLKAARSVAGVKEVVNALDAHQVSENVAELQGGRPRYGTRIDFMQTNWAPSTRLISMVAGSSLAADGFRRSVIGLTETVLGTALVARSASNQPVSRLMHVQKHV